MHDPTNQPSPEFKGSDPIGAALVAVRKHLLEFAESLKKTSSLSQKERVMLADLSRELVNTCMLYQAQGLLPLEATAAVARIARTFAPKEHEHNERWHEALLKGIEFENLRQKPVSSLVMHELIAYAFTTPGLDLDHRKAMVHAAFVSTSHFYSRSFPLNKISLFSDPSSHDHSKYHPVVQVAGLLYSHLPLGEQEKEALLSEVTNATPLPFQERWKKQLECLSFPPTAENIPSSVALSEFTNICIAEFKKSPHGLEAPLTMVEKLFSGIASSDASTFKKYIYLTSAEKIVDAILSALAQDSLISPDSSAERIVHRLKEAHKVLPLPMLNFSDEMIDDVAEQCYTSHERIEKSLTKMEQALAVKKACKKVEPYIYAPLYKKVSGWVLKNLLFDYVK